MRVKQIKRRQEQRTVLLLTDEKGRTAVEKRPSKGLLAGMYQLPNFDGFLTEREIRSRLEADGWKVMEITFLKDAKHVFTHLDWFMKGFQVWVAAPSEMYEWATPAQLHDQYALPTAFKPFIPSC